MAQLATQVAEVLDCLSNGADAVGVVEQSDLLFVEDALTMLRGADAIRQIRPFAP